MAAVFKLEVDQGTDTAIPFTLYQDDGVTELDLTGYTARMQVRQDIDSSGTLLSLTTENSGISISGGTVTIQLAAAATTAMTVYQGQYDLELIDASSKVERIVQGPFCLNREVTR